MSAAKTKTAHPGRIFLSKSKNRPYLPSCPADIVNAEFYLDLKLQKKVMKLCIRNRSDRPLTSMTVLARYLDKNGHVIGDPDGHIILRFTNIFCAPHETSLGSKTVVLPYQDIAGIEAYITSLTYENGDSEEFSLEDYTLAPEQDMLENRLSPEDFRLVKKRYGESCVFCAQALPGGNWLCTCGAVCQGDACSACSMSRASAMRLSDPRRAPAMLRALRIRRTVLRILPYAAALVLFAGGAFVLQRYAARYIRETLPQDRLAVTRLYISENRYAEALGYSVGKNHSLLYDEIIDSAVNYYCAQQSFSEAAAYERCREEPDYAPIYEAAARAFLHGGGGDCADYALSVSDDALYNSVLRKMAEDALGKGESSAACSLALAMRGEEGSRYADELLYRTIGELLEKTEYEQAVSYIGYLRDKSGVPALCRGIEQELLARGKYDDAFTVASITGDTTVFEIAYPDANATTLRRYFDKFSPYMSAERRRTFLASEISAGGSLVTSTQNGEALDSSRGVLCADAVSVAAGGAHVLVLQKDGTVRAFGDNAFGQCGCDGLGGAVAVAAGISNSLVLLEDGTVRAFGDNDAGQCDTAAWQNVIAIAAGTAHSAALTADGTVAACGSDASGQCSVGGYSDVVAIAAGAYSTVLLFRDGSVAAQGNISLETFSARAWDSITRIAAGNSHLIALSAGGRVLFAGTPEYAGADSVTDWSRVRYIACGERSSYALDANGHILFCGSDTPSLSGIEWESLLP